MKFEKWQGCGNDFVMIDCFKEKINNFERLAIKTCDRHFGIGADGLIAVLPSKVADFKMRIFNPDGTEAEMCGNGIRCFSKMIYENHLTDKTSFTVETGAGILVPRFEIENNEILSVCVDMGKPIFQSEDIPTTIIGKSKVVDEPIEVLGKTYNFTAVSMGNPHCVLFFDNLDDVSVETLGPVIEKHKLFPHKINVEFAEIKDKNHIKMRVWERGAAVTLACGTGACATLIAAVLKNLTERTAEIEIDGGNLKVEWKEDDHIYMTGSAKRVFVGEYKNTEENVV